MTDDTTTETSSDQLPVNGDQEPPSAPPAPPHEDTAPTPLLAARRPRSTRGQYIVLAAKVTEQEPPRYRELGYTKAHSRDAAKKIAFACPVHGPRLKRTAREAGVIVRAVALEHWPKTDPSKVETTESLVIG